MPDPPARLAQVELFEENGGRVDREILDDDATIRNWTVNNKLRPDIHFSHRMGTATQKRDFYLMRNGVFKNGPDGSHAGKQNVAMIKPYIISRHPDKDDNTRVQHFPLDRCRVFGKAISNSNPFEMVDVMLSRQAI